MITLFNISGLSRAQMKQITLQLESLKGNIMATKAELAQDLRDMKVRNDKARQEVIDKIGQLEAEIAAGGGSTPEIDTAMEELKASIHMDDELVPDAVVPPPVEPPVPPVEPNPVDPSLPPEPTLPFEPVTDPNPPTSNPVAEPAEPASDTGSPIIEDPDRRS